MGRHSPTNQSHGFSWITLLLAFLTLILINVKLAHFTRGLWGIEGLRYVSKCVNAVSVIQIMEFAALYLLIRDARRLMGLRHVAYLVLAAVLAFFSVEGHYFDHKGSVDFFERETFFVFLSLLHATGYFVIYSCVLIHLDALMARMAPLLLGSDRPEDEVSGWPKLFDRHVGLIVFTVFCVSIVPYMLLSYPGFFMGDTDMQVSQALMRPESAVLTNKHPVAHTLLLRLCPFVGDGLLHSANQGIFLYTIVQTLLMGLALAYCACVMVKDFHANRGVVIALIAVLAFHPRVRQYCMIVTKDGLYAASVLLMAASSCRILKRAAKNPDFLVWGFASLLAVLFRRDGIFVIAPTLGLFVLLGPAKKKAAAALATVVALYMLWNSVLMPAIGAVPGSGRAVYSVLFQQTARYVQDYPDDITASERQAISRVLGDPDELDDAYVPTLVDSVMTHYNDACTSEDLKAYVGAWYRMLLRHPDSYIRSFCHFKYQYFYPTIHKSNYYSYRWSAEVMQMVNDKCATDFSYPPGMQQVRRGYELLREAIFSLPILRFLLDSYPYVFLTLFLLFYTIIHRRTDALPATSLLVLLLLIMLVGPTNGYYIRYTLPMIVSLPVCCLLLLSTDAAQQE